MRRDSFNVKRHLRDSQKFLGRGFVVAYTDGSYNMKNGVGGYGVYIQHEKTEKKLSVGPIFHANVSRMELRAIYETLKMVDKHEKLVIYCDSQYVVNVAMGWVNPPAGSVLAANTRKEYLLFDSSPMIKWIPAHIGIEGGATADRLAEEGRKIWVHSSKK